MTAPAAMPGEEKIARLLYEHVCGHYNAKPYWENEPAEIHHLHGSMARAVLALFAPILAEKERQYELASEGRAAFAARALAAEAALAGERERCALIAANETIHPLGEQIAAAMGE